MRDFISPHSPRPDPKYMVDDGWLYVALLYKARTADLLLHFQLFLESLAGCVSLNTKAFPSVRSHCLSIVSVKLHNASSRLCAGFLKYILPRGQNVGPCQWENEIRPHAVRHYTLQEVNTLIQITRRLSSCGGVKTQITVLHGHRHKAPLCKLYRGI